MALHADAVDPRPACLQFARPASRPSSASRRIPFVVVVVVQLGVRIGLVGKLIGLVDVVVADDFEPLRLAASCRRGIDRFVDDVPAVDPALVAADHGVDVLSHPRQQRLAVERLAVVILRTTQAGVWLCQTSVWPTMNMPCFSPNSTYLSAGSKS